ncbi:MAG: formate/nitrite transporter family protein [Clostridia bacterium]|nr:formate/nitrite transporter family protein [Clostridia bacterium]
MLIFKRIMSGFASGVLIGIGGTVYLLCENKVVGAVFFSVALLCICYKEFSLFTGKVGYLAHSRTRKDLSVLFCGLLGNFAGASFTAFFISFAYRGAKLYDPAAALARAKLEQTIPETLIRAFMCGILMYMAVSIFKSKKTPLGILFCIPVFILSGLEHSIADIFYLTAGFGSHEPYLYKALLFVLLAIIGNAAGAIAIALLDKTKEEPEKPKEVPDEE